MVPPVSSCAYWFSFLLLFLCFLELRLCRFSVLFADLVSAERCTAVAASPVTPVPLFFLCFRDPSVSSVGISVGLYTKPVAFALATPTLLATCCKQKTKAVPRPEGSQP